MPSFLEGLFLAQYRVLPKVGYISLEALRRLSNPAHSEMKSAPQAGDIHMLAL